VNFLIQILLFSLTHYLIRSTGRTLSYAFGLPLFFVFLFIWLLLLLLRLLLHTIFSYLLNTETIVILSYLNFNYTISTANAEDNEKSQKVNWWVSELDSLGMKQEESNKGQVLENLTDDIKQKFIYDYKACYSE
jgi:hypothetical protein